MAKLILTEVSARDLARCLGPGYVARRQRGHLVVYARPDMSNASCSPRQRAQRTLFAEAQAFARQVMASPAQAAAYKKWCKPGQRLRECIVAMYLAGRRAAND